MISFREDKAQVTEKPRRYKFGKFDLDTLARELTKDGESLPSPPTETEFDLLHALVAKAWEHPGEKLAFEDLLRKVWPDDFDSSGNIRPGLEDAFGKLHRQMYNLREKLKPPDIITRTKGTYVLAAPVQGVQSDQDVHRVTIGISPDTKRTPALSFPVSGHAIDHADSPYVGSQPFSTEQADLFFGREAECATLINLLADGEKRVVLLYSPSGAGKTSLINTALRTGLLRRGFAVLPVARVGIPLKGLLPDEPPEALNLYTFAAISSMAAETSAGGSAGSTWAEYLSAQISADDKGLVLIVDQLEEIITITPPLGPKKHVHDFFLQLREALEQHQSLRVLLSCREEYRSQLERRLAKELSPFSTSYDLDRLTLEAAREAIILPANRRGISFDPEVVDTLVKELACDRYLDEAGRSREEVGEFIEPFQLQIVCDSLWGVLWRVLSERVRHVSWPQIEQIMPTGPDDDGCVHVKDNIGKFVDSVLKNFCGLAIEDVAGREAFPVDSIDLGFQQFISKRGTRLIVHRDAGDLPNRVVEGLAERHLLRVIEHNRERSYELAHDTLIEPIRERAEMALRRRRRSRFPRVVAIVIVCVLATIAAVAMTMTVRALDAYLGATLTQPPDTGWVAGWFHGVIGALIWGVFIALGLSSSWFLVESGPLARRPRRAALVGAASGFIGGVFITIALLWAQRADSLYGALWILTPDAGSRWTAFTVTGMGYCMLFFGTAAGLGAGVTASRILLGTKWNALVESHCKPRSWSETRRVLAAISRLVVIAEGWSVLLPMTVAALLFGLLLRYYRLHFVQPQWHGPVKSGLLSVPLWARLTGECLSISCGVLGLTVGLLFGVYLLRKGIDVPDEEIFSFSR